jgi:hypothetical protein
MKLHNIHEAKHISRPHTPRLEAVFAFLKEDNPNIRLEHVARFAAYIEYWSEPRPSATEWVNARYYGINALKENTEEIEEIFKEFFDGFVEDAIAWSELTDLWRRAKSNKHVGNYP